MAQPAAAGVRPRGPDRDRRTMGAHFVTAQPDRGPQHARSLIVVSKRRPAADGTARGAMWSALIAISYFLMSHPREMFPNFTTSMWFLALLSLVVMAIDARMVSAPVLPWTVVLFLGICTMSVFWSVGPSDTVRALGLYGSIALLGALVVSNTDVAALLRGIVWGAFIVAGLTLSVLCMKLAGWQVPASATEVAGFHGNRNVVSYTLVLGLCAALCYAPRGRWGVLRWLVVLCAILGVLFLARSGTGWLAAAMLIATRAALALAHKFDLFHSLRARLMGFVAVAGTATASLASLGSVSELLGKTADLSGRGPLWDAILSIWRDAPFGGFGFGAIWSYSWFAAHPNEPKTLIDERTGAWLPHGHNMFLDLLPQVGLVGVLGSIIVILMAVRWLFVPLTEKQYLAARWAALGLLGVMLCGITEPMIATPVGWFVVVVTAATAQRLARSRDWLL